MDQKLLRASGICKVDEIGLMETRLRKPNPKQV